MKHLRYFENNNIRTFWLVPSKNIPKLVATLLKLGIENDDIDRVISWTKNINTDNFYININEPGKFGGVIGYMPIRMADAGYDSDIWYEENGYTRGNSKIDMKDMKKAYDWLTLYNAKKFNI